MNKNGNSSFENNYGVGWSVNMTAATGQKFSISRSRFVNNSVGSIYALYGGVNISSSRFVNNSDNIITALYGGVSVNN